MPARREENRDHELRPLLPTSSAPSRSESSRGPRSGDLRFFREAAPHSAEILTDTIYPTSFTCWARTCRLSACGRAMFEIADERIKTMRRYLRAWFILALYANCFGVARAGVTYSTKEPPKGGTTYTWTVVATDDTPIHSLEITGDTTGPVIKGIDPKKDITEPAGWGFTGDAGKGIYNWANTVDKNTSGTFTFSITFPTGSITNETGLPAARVDYDTTDGNGNTTKHSTPPPRDPTDGNYIMVPTAVPEPSSLVLLGLGVAGSVLASFGARKRGSRVR